MLLIYCNSCFFMFSHSDPIRTVCTLFYARHVIRKNYFHIANQTSYFSILGKNENETQETINNKQL